MTDGPEGQIEGSPTIVGVLVGTVVGNKVGVDVIAVVLMAEGFRVKSFVRTTLCDEAQATFIVTIPLLGIVTVTDELPLGIIRKLLLHLPFTKLPEEI